jgi:hypothetical protein
MFQRSGQQSQTYAVYHSGCPCRVELELRKGDTFPNCPQCDGDVDWMFTRSSFETPRPSPEPPPKSD